MSTELAEKKAEQNLLSVIERIASNPDSDIDKLERMLDMQERVLNRNALMAYNDDMAKLQSEMPTISKKGEITVNNVVRSKYARFEDIMDCIRPMLDQFGFSVSFKTEFIDNGMKVLGRISHREGHSEETSMLLPFDTSGSKNQVQAIGSSVSYGKRYVLCMLLNIATSGEDDDGNAADDIVTRLIRMADVAKDCWPTITAIKESLCIEDYATAREAWNELSEEDQQALWIAPTRGGLFTIEERKKMKSTEWMQTNG